MLTNLSARHFSINASRSGLTAIMLCLLGGMLGGCVSSTKFEEVSAERDDLLKKQSALDSNARLLRNRAESSEEQSVRLKVELEDTQTKLADTNKALDTKNVKLAETSKLLDEKNIHLSMASEELERRQDELRRTEQALGLMSKKLAETTEYVDKTKKLYTELVGHLSTELEANQIKISELKDGISVNLSESILFPSGSAILSDTGIGVIKKVSGSLKSIPHQIIVAGFTDNVAIKGDLAKQYPSNWELAGARAASVVRLLESEGVDSDKMTAVSFGENKPVASNDNWKTRALNRRIEIRLRPAE